MNKDLKGRVFDVPQEILDLINHTITGLNGENHSGVQRAKKLLNDKKVKYGQLKRILHDCQNIDKVKEKVKYNLCGGQKMEDWAKKHLQGERDLIKSKKHSRMMADEVGGLDGERKNSYNKKHTKRFNFKIPTNLVKSNSQKSTISPIVDLKLFEQLERIKKLM